MIPWRCCWFEIGGRGEWLDLVISAVGQPVLGEDGSLSESIERKFGATVVREVDGKLLRRIVISHHRQNSADHHHWWLDYRVSCANEYVHPGQLVSEPVVSIHIINPSKTHSHIYTGAETMRGLKGAQPPPTYNLTCILLFIFSFNCFKQNIWYS